MLFPLTISMFLAAPLGGRLTDRFGERTGIRTDYASSFHDRLPDEVETRLFRITQEALTNVARHSGASEVLVELHRVEDRVALSIEDNGHGIQRNTNPKGPSLGMTGMRARAAPGSVVRK